MSTGRTADGQRPTLECVAYITGQQSFSLLHSATKYGRRQLKFNSPPRLKSVAAVPCEVFMALRRTSDNLTEYSINPFVNSIYWMSAVCSLTLKLSHDARHTVHKYSWTLQGAATWRIEWHDPQAIARIFWKFRNASCNCLPVMLQLSVVTNIRTQKQIGLLDRQKVGLAVWLSGNALASINVVALRQTRLVPGWVTVCGRVNRLGM